MSFFFFFSSRRRHTRSLCDWSSDVCSSDLRTAYFGTRANAALVWNGVEEKERSTDVTNQPEIRIGCTGPQTLPSTAVGPFHVGRPMTCATYDYRKASR